MKRDVQTITTFEELQRKKLALKDEIYFQELEFKETALFKIGSSLLQGKSMKSYIVDSVSPFNLKGIINGPIGSLLSTILLANKRTRKYFVTFTIAKEIIPFALQRIKGILNSENYK